MQTCLYVHPDNIEASKKELNVKVAIIARPDWYMPEAKCQQIIVETERGVHTRCYLAEHEGYSFIIVYGRFGRVRSTAHDIDFELTQEALSFLGITHIIGTFVVGSIQEDDKAGVVYILDDFIGLGGYNQARTRHRAIGFRNVDMLKPFCDLTRQALCQSAKTLPFSIKEKGTYVCFHGWPRLETGAELAHYGRMQCDVVGQTLDPEVTLAKEAGCCYAAIAVTIDDHEIRTRFLANDHSGLQDLNSNMVEGRKKTFDVFLAALPELTRLANDTCRCSEQAKLKTKRSEHFYYRPKHLIVDENE